MLSSMQTISGDVCTIPTTEPKSHSAELPNSFGRRVGKLPVLCIGTVAQSSSKCHGEMFFGVVFFSPTFLKVTDQLIFLLGFGEIFVSKQSTQLLKSSKQERAAQA